MTQQITRLNNARSELEIKARILKEAWRRSLPTPAMQVVNLNTETFNKYAEWLKEKGFIKFTHGDHDKRSSYRLKITPKGTSYLSLSRRLLKLEGITLDAYPRPAKCPDPCKEYNKEFLTCNEEPWNCPLRRNKQ